RYAALTPHWRPHAGAAWYQGKFLQLVPAAVVVQGIVRCHSEWLGVDQVDAEPEFVVEDCIGADRILQAADAKPPILVLANDIREIPQPTHRRIVAVQLKAGLPVTQVERCVEGSADRVPLDDV